MNPALILAGPYRVDREGQSVTITPLRFHKCAMSIWTKRAEVSRRANTLRGQA